MCNFPWRGTNVAQPGSKAKQQTTNKQAQQTTDTNKNSTIVTEKQRNTRSASLSATVQPLRYPLASSKSATSPKRAGSGCTLIGEKARSDGKPKNTEGSRQCGVSQCASKRKRRRNEHLPLSPSPSLVFCSLSNMARHIAFYAPLPRAHRL